MSDRQALMEEFFELGAEMRRLAGEYRNVMAPIQERRKAIESALVGGCDSDCASCSSQATPVLPVTGRTLN